MPQSSANTVLGLDVRRCLPCDVWYWHQYYCGQHAMGHSLIQTTLVPLTAGTWFCCGYVVYGAFTNHLCLNVPFVLVGGPVALLW
ncbi:hypothetical protein COO60DRAFT_1500334 [Scenedesmus sp. NREL 46B-D3]|nr:hypothetical protein COO60DRAFT_1500334 [Scenedesmus sp. NREL 46B-D3]